MAQRIDAVSAPVISRHVVVGRGPAQSIAYEVQTWNSFCRRPQALSLLHVARRSAYIESPVDHACSRLPIVFAQVLGMRYIGGRIFCPQKESSLAKPHSLLLLDPCGASKERICAEAKIADHDGTELCGS